MDHLEIFHTTNLKVAAVLSTLGFETHTPPVTRIVREDGRESIVFWFKPTNADGQAALTIYHQMTKGGEKLNAEDPENVINFVRIAMANLDEWRSLVRDCPRDVCIVTNNGRISIREGASEATRKTISELI